MKKLLILFIFVISLLTLISCSGKKQSVTSDVTTLDSKVTSAPVTTTRGYVRLERPDRDGIEIKGGSDISLLWFNNMINAKIPGETVAYKLYENITPREETLPSSDQNYYTVYLNNINSQNINVLEREYRIYNANDIKTISDTLSLISFSECDKPNFSLDVYSDMAISSYTESTVTARYYFVLDPERRAVYKSIGENVWKKADEFPSPERLADLVLPALLTRNAYGNYPTGLYDYGLTVYWEKDEIHSEITLEYMGHTVKVSHTKTDAFVSSFENPTPESEYRLNTYAIGEINFNPENCIKLSLLAWRSGEWQTVTFYIDRNGYSIKELNADAKGSNEINIPTTYYKDNYVFYLSVKSENPIGRFMPMTYDFDGILSYMEEQLNK